jgi:hypothetical protein
MPVISSTPSTLGGGLLSAALSTLALAWRGRREHGSPAAPINAISHWFFPQRAFAHDDVSLRYTGSGLAVHVASSMLWAAAYAWLRGRRERPAAAAALGDAAAVGALAAFVDLGLTPKRLSPGFEERMGPSGLVWVYAAFAGGLALAGVLAARRRT